MQERVACCGKNVVLLARQHNETGAAMRTEPAKVECFTILQSPDICDPILVVMQDFGGGMARMIVECYGVAWSGYWGAMGDRSLREFFVSCDLDYLSDRMAPHTGRESKRTREWRKRVLNVVQQALYEAGLPGSDGASL